MSPLKKALKKLGQEIPGGKRMLNKIDKIKLVIEGDSDPDPSFLEQEEWADRKDAYEKGEFGFIGIFAKATISIPTKQGGYSSIQSVRTPGLWGIESDSDVDYFKEVGQEELDNLRDHLEALNVDLSNFDSLAEQALNVFP